MCSDFVGRQQEMSQMTAALDDALSGQGRVLVLAGEPGIGKTCAFRTVYFLPSSCSCRAYPLPLGADRGGCSQ